ncbi:hypothetical protein HNP84_007829 [Thermocatellispora tengchongensis]|uniref:DUF397 domain-containing protein n=1 Tax=Thermocatellispora tengchongensis TaxID=1073253 RepID=A0A840PGX1_9ACTN|nr:DUF397 domain-containing protein [Thermocatellispora tengchongensis]MBB5138076.1 hypothetical protein [Thermocatellispora tengchongensis]
MRPSETAPSDLDWQTPPNCAGGNCIQVARSGDGVLMRDSKNPDMPHIRFSPESWAAFVRNVKTGRYDRESR